MLTKIRFKCYVLCIILLKLNNLGDFNACNLLQIEMKILNFKQGRKICLLN